MINFLEYFAPLSTDIERGYRSVLILKEFYELAKNREILKLINKNIWFWDNTVNAHKCNIFINLGKVLDTDDKTQSIHFLKRWLISNQNELKEETILARKGKENYEKFKDNMFFQGFHKFTNHDFANFGRKIKQINKRYEAKFKDWRDKIYAHREHFEGNTIKLESITLDEIEEMYSELYGLYQDSFDALYNGYNFPLAPRKYLVEIDIRNQIKDILKPR